jgi:hypothetical protein
MDTISMNAIQAIQAILAPAVGISAVGLLLLGMSNRYSAIIARIRLLNDERRRFTRQIAEQQDLSYADNARFMNIRKQTEELLSRSRTVRNAILAMQTAIGLFVLTSVGIGLSLVAGKEFDAMVPLGLFLVGMLCVFVGISFAGLDVYRSFRVVLLEAKAEE